MQTLFFMNGQSPGTVNGVIPQLCTPTSKMSLGLTGEISVVTLILYVRVVSSEPVRGACVYTMFCFEKKSGGSC